MDQIKKLINSDLFIRICLWGMFIAGVGFTILKGITVIGVMAIVGTLLMAVDFPRRERRKK